MMKKSSYYTILCLLFGLFGCVKMNVEIPALTVTTDKTTYKVGDDVKFYFTGAANYVTFFPGTGLLYSAIEGTTYKQGYRYEYVTRITAPGKPVFSFRNKRNNATGTKAGSLKLLISSDFNGTVDIDNITKATWTDISSLVTWATSTSLTTSSIDLSEYKNAPVYFAFKFTGDANTAQNGWTVDNFVMTNMIDGEIGPYYIFGSTASVGWSEVKFGAASSSDTYKWTVNSTPNIATSATAANLPAFDGWLISSKFDLTTVTPDIGIKIKSFSEILPPFYSYQYWVPGEYKVTFVGSNASVYGEEKVVADVVITITN